MPKVFKSGGDLQEWRCKLSSATPLVDKSYNCPTSQNRSLETTIFLIFKYESRLAKNSANSFSTLVWTNRSRNRILRQCALLTPAIWAPAIGARDPIPMTQMLESGIACRVSCRRAVREDYVHSQLDELRGELRQPIHVTFGTGRQCKLSQF